MTKSILFNCMDCLASQVEDVFKSSRSDSKPKMIKLYLRSHSHRNRQQLGLAHDAGKHIDLHNFLLLYVN